MNEHEFDKWFHMIWRLIYQSEVYHMHVLVTNRLFTTLSTEFYLRTLLLSYQLHVSIITE